MLLLTVNRKPWMGSPMTPSHLTLNDLQRSKSCSIVFQSLISLKGTDFGHILPITIKRKPYMASSMKSSHFTLSDSVRLKSRSLRILSGRRAVCYTHICRYCITTVIYMSQKGLMQAGGVFPLPQLSFLLLL